MAPLSAILVPWRLSHSLYRSACLSHSASHLLLPPFGAAAAAAATAGGGGGGGVGGSCQLTGVRYKTSWVSPSAAAAATATEAGDTEDHQQQQQRQYRQQQQEQQLRHQFPVLQRQHETGVLTVPHHLVRCAVRRQRRAQLSSQGRCERQRTSALSQGNRRVALITCSSDSRLNHHLHQTYERLRPPPLCSQHWNRSDKAGDQFVIHRRPVNQLDNKTNGVDDSTVQDHDHEASQDSFAHLPIDRVLVANLASMGVEKPTSIQTAAWRSLMPSLLSGGARGGGGGGSGCSMLVAQTGRGKTLAYLVPIVQKLLNTPAPLSGTASGESPPPVYNQPRVIVVTPGRELAAQIKGVCRRLIDSTGLRVSLLLGTGVRKRLLNPQPVVMDILVASLGVLNKLLAANVISLARVRHLVLDEADTLLDDTFHDDTHRLVSRLSIDTGTDHQQGEETGGATVVTSLPTTAPLSDLTLVSATVPCQLNNLLGGVLMPDALNEIVSPDIHQLQTNLEHKFIRVASAEKSRILVELCRQIVANNESAIIFSNSGKCASYVSLLLADNSLACIDLSARLSPQTRRGRWHHFLHTRPALISCTDVVSRGLDPAGVHHVINFEAAWNVSDYIHRAGRLGRAGDTVPGTVTSLVHKRPEIWVTQVIELAVRLGQRLKSVDANISRLIERRASYK